MYIFYINFTRGLCNVLHVYVLSNLNQEKNSLYLIKGKTYTSKKKIKSEISKRVYSNILKDRRLWLKHLPSLNLLSICKKKKRTKKYCLRLTKICLKSPVFAKTDRTHKYLVQSRLNHCDIIEIHWHESHRQT